MSHAAIQDLTPAQQAAVTHVEGPLLVLAGAGSGKTRVITRRVAHLIAQGVPPDQILAITFTNKAAGEMRERIGVLTRGARVQVSTFHAFAARTLRRYAEWVGRTSRFTILDDADQRAAMREALVETGTDPKLYGVPKVLYAVERAKDRLQTPSDAAAAAASPFEETLARAYAYYQEFLDEHDALDFSDLLVKTVELLRHDEVREVLSRRHRFLLIDEYQDTNHSQYTVARLLSQAHRNICATGDPNQSIYGWRGADIGNILRFEEDYPEAKVVKLEQNFRSTRTILQAANGLILHNTERRDVELVSEAEEGRPLELRILDDERTEGRFVAREIQRRILAGASARELAVFYRANALSRHVEVGLLEVGVPFQVIGSVPFFQRKEVKDLLAFLRLVENPKDDLAFARVVNVPPRGVGKTTLGKLRARAREAGGSLLEAARELSRGGEVKGKAQRGLLEVVELLDGLRAHAEGEPRVEEVLREVALRTQYRDFLTKEFPEDAEDRLMNVEELLAAARELDLEAPVPLAAPAPAAPPRAPEPAEPPPTAARPAPGEAFPLFGAPPEPSEPPAPAPAPAPEPSEAAPLAGGLAAFLEHAALVSERTQDDEGAAERVSLMTVHSAKGLEFDTVFVIALEEGIFPHSKTLDEPSGLEEERRLAYVAVTRARKEVILTRANWRTWKGRSTPQNPSLFLAQLPSEVFPAGASPLELERSFALSHDTAADEFDGVDPPHAEDEGTTWLELDEAEGPAWRRPLRRRAGPSPDAPPRPALPSPLARALDEARQSGVLRRGLERPDEARPAAAADLAVGDRVHHEQFGPGVIQELSGSGLRRRARVQFAAHGEKNLVLQYARLTRVPR